jgi:hypothetical protein
MTTPQQKLSEIWAADGGAVDPGDAKYATGWVAEIPTYQNFNYVLQTTTTNILSYAESDIFDWEIDISYSPGARVRRFDVVYYCIRTAEAIDPDTDTNKDYWTNAPTIGAVPSADDAKKGMHLDLVDVTPKENWSGNAMTITGVRPSIALNTTGGFDNHVLCNQGGYLSTINTGTQAVPDNRVTTDKDTGEVYRIFHEGFPPNNNQVGGLDDAPEDGAVYGRRNTSTIGGVDMNWAIVTGTTVQTDPPPPVFGGGSGWYNLSDGIHYTDINDGDSSQWVPSNPSSVPEAKSIPFDNEGTSTTGSTMQDAIFQLSARLDAIEGA